MWALGTNECGHEEDPLSMHSTAPLCISRRSMRVRASARGRAPFVKKKPRHHTDGETPTALRRSAGRPQGARRCRDYLAMGGDSATRWSPSAVRRRHPPTSTVPTLRPVEQQASHVYSSSKQRRSLKQPFTIRRGGSVCRSAGNGYGHVYR